jgi:hypothetical protein
MPNVQNTQGTGTKAPPIPTMDVSPPPAATGAEIRKEAGDFARKVKIAVQDAKKSAQDAHKASDAGHAATTTVPSPALNPNDMIPPEAVNMTYAFFLTMIVCVIGFPLARAFARRVDRKTEVKTIAGPDLTPHIRQLQDSVDAMAIELERISEGQRFTAKLLAERSGGSQQQ